MPNCKHCKYCDRVLHGMGFLAKLRGQFFYGCTRKYEYADITTADGRIIENVHVKGKLLWCLAERKSRKPRHCGPKGTFFCPAQSE